MIRGIHGLFYSSQPGALRAFLRDKLGLPCVDIGGGWLIFRFDDGELGVHPVEEKGAPSGTHDVSFYCDDLRGTVAELRARGVRFDGEITHAGFGLVTKLTMPGNVRAIPYEPKYEAGGCRPGPLPAPLRGACEGAGGRVGREGAAKGPAAGRG